MKWGYLGVVVAVLAIVLIGGCTQPPTTGQVGLSDTTAQDIQDKPVCNKPYILVGTECCLDNNDNKICDKDEAPTQANLCEGIVCGDKCEGFTRLSGGTCSNGACSYAARTENSSECGYAPKKIKLGIDLVDCLWWSDGQFWFWLKNIGEISTPENASIWLFIDNGYKGGQLMNKSYPQNQYLLGANYNGQSWRTDMGSITNHYDFTFVYCNPSIPYNECSKDNGVILYKGNTSECGTEIERGGYFYNDNVGYEKTFNEDGAIPNLMGAGKYSGSMLLGGVISIDPVAKTVQLELYDLSAKTFEDSKLGVKTATIGTDVSVLFDGVVESNSLKVKDIGVNAQTGISYVTLIRPNFIIEIPVE